MATFPAAPLPAVTEMYIDGAWTDISSDVREESGLDIVRGRANESGRVAPSRLSLTLDNRSAAYSNRMPTALYYGRLGRNTQIRHRIRWIRDTFSRTVSSSWDVTDTLQAWANTGGSASDFSVNGSKGFHTLTSVNVIRNSLVTLPAGTADAMATANVSATATGASLTARVMVGTSSTNYYGARLDFTTAGNVTLQINKNIGGSGATVVAAVTVGTYTPAVQWNVRFKRTGSGYLRAKAWLATDAEPAAWTLTSTSPETEITGFTVAGLLSRAETGSTNVNPVVAWDNFSVNDYRFWGEVPSWPQVWESSGADVTAPIEAAGIMRRLGGSTRPLRSALTRAMAGISEGDFVPIAHWPMEDGSDATSFASNLSGQPAATLTGSVSPASYSGFAGSDPLPVLTQGEIQAVFPSYVDTGVWQAQFTMMIPSSGFSNDADMIIIPMVPGKPTATIYLTYIQSSGELQLSALNAAGTSLATGATVGNTWQRDTPYLCAISDVVSGGTHIVVFSMWLPNGNNLLSVNIQPDGFGAGTAGMPSRASAIASSVSSGWSFGQLALYTADILSAPNIGPNAQGAGGYDGETATDRMIRLCREEGIYLDIIGDTTDSAPMGPQTTGKLLDLLFSCSDADLGILYEPRDALGLAYRTRPSLYNQTGLMLDYAASQVFAPFAPTEDDQAIVNDATARRVNGSWARVTAEPGPLSTSDPPDGVGTYDEDRTYNVATDTQLAPIAGWRVHVGAWDEARYPTVHAMPHAPGIAASPALMGRVAAVDVGDYLSVDNPPAWLPPDLIELLAQGYRETLHTFEWDLIWVAVPAGPYKVFTLDSATLGRLAGDQALASSVTTTGTSWSVATLSGPVLSAVDADDGQQWMVEGELVTVTDIAGTSSPQTVTVTRSVNGVVKAHGSGAACKLFPAPYLAL